MKGLESIQVRCGKTVYCLTSHAFGAGTEISVFTLFSSLSPADFDFVHFLRRSSCQRILDCMASNITAPAHPHVTEIALYPALFFQTLTIQIQIVFF